MNGIAVQVRPKNPARRCRLRRWWLWPVPCLVGHLSVSRCWKISHVSKNHHPFQIILTKIIQMWLQTSDGNLKATFRDNCRAHLSKWFGYMLRKPHLSFRRVGDRTRTRSETWCLMEMEHLLELQFWQRRGNNTKPFTTFIRPFHFKEGTWDLT